MRWKLNFETGEFMEMNKKSVKIGIDAGRHTGIALMNNDTGKVFGAQTLDFWRAHDFILDNYPPDFAEITIESLNAKGALYSRAFSATQSGRDRFAQNVGSVRRETSLLIERLQAKGYTVNLVKPVKGGKWTQKQFEQATGLKIRTSEHARDAARILFHG